MKPIPQGSFKQNKQEVIDLLKRKYEKGKLSHMGKKFIEQQNSLTNKATCHDVIPD